MAIILLNWNGRDDTIECLRSLEKLEYPHYEVIVVDNDSSDDSVLQLRQGFPQITLIENPVNLGFAQGNNVGISAGLDHGADFIFMLNNDTVVDKQVLDHLLDASEQYPAAGAFGAKIYYYSDPERLWYAGARWQSYKADFDHVGGSLLDNGHDWEKIEETAYACGCALFARSDMMRSNGLLDPAFFALWEESDWCYRARRTGHASLFVPQAKVWHKVSASFEGGWRQPHYQYYYWRNRLLWMERNLPRRETLHLYRYVVWNQLKDEWRRSRDPLLSDHERLLAKAGLAGARDYLLRRFGRGPSWLLRPRSAS